MARSPRTEPADPWAAGTVPGTSRDSSRKFRPLSGRPANLPVVDHRALRRRFCLHRAALRGDDDGFGALSGEERNIQPDLLIDKQFDGLNVLAESFALGFQAVGSGSEQRDDKFAS